MIADDETKNRVKDMICEVATVLVFVMLVKWVQGESPPTTFNCMVFFVSLTFLIFALHKLNFDASSVAEGVIKGQLFNQLLTLIT